jgi:hypothetical protein
MKYIQSFTVKLLPFMRHILVSYKLILIDSLKISYTCLIYIIARTPTRIVHVGW